MQPLPSPNVDDDTILCGAVRICQMINHAIDVNSGKRAQVSYNHITSGPRRSEEQEFRIEELKRAGAALQQSDRYFLQILRFKEKDEDWATVYITEIHVGDKFHDQALFPWTSRAGAIATKMRNALEAGDQPTFVNVKWTLDDKSRGPAHPFNGEFQVGGLWTAEFRACDAPESVRRICPEDSAGQQVNFQTADDSAQQFEPTAFSLQSIVGTLDESQDDIIRGGFTGVSIITGAPGVGKTTAAIHRMPFLINEHAKYSERSKRVEKPQTFRSDNQLVLLPKDHLVPYVRGLVKKFLPEFPEKHITTVERWTLAEVSRLFGLGLPGSFSLAEDAYDGVAPVEQWKSLICDGEIRWFARVKSNDGQKSFESSVAGLLEFYERREVIIMLSKLAGDDFDARVFCDAIEKQRTTKTITCRDVYLLLWLAQEASEVGQSRSISRYSHIIVDESQYVDPLLLTLLPKLVCDGGVSGLVTLVGDSEQVVQDGRKLTSFDNLEFDGVSTTKVQISTAYRWTKEVFPFVEKVHRLMRRSGRLEPPRNWRVTGGLRPEVYCDQDEQRQIFAMVSRVQELRNAPATHRWRIAIAVDERGQGEAEILSSMRGAGIQADIVYGEELERVVGTTVITSIDDISGVDFDAVFLPFQPGLVFNQQQRSEQRRGRLWVALTRGRRFLWLGMLADSLNGSALNLGPFLVQSSLEG